MIRYQNKVLPPIHVAPPRHSRGGVVPVVKLKGHPEETWIAMGLDRKHTELTDFGGMLKRHETFPEAAMREFREETLKVFSIRLPSSKLAYYHENGFIIFYIYTFDTQEELDKFTYRILKDFEDRVTSKDEVEKIIWFPIERFEAMLEDIELHNKTPKEYVTKYKYVFYPRIYKFLTSIDLDPVFY